MYWPGIAGLGSMLVEVTCKEPPKTVAAMNIMNTATKILFFIYNPS
jgi:hypothetical protein